MAMNLEISKDLRLTEFHRSDKAALVEYLSDRDIYERTLRLPHPYTNAEADKWFAILEELREAKTQDFNWAIRDGAGRLIGGSELKAPQEESLHRAEIGYWLAKPFWGRGLMTAVVARVCRFGFENLGLAKITANVFAWNTPSARVLEKCGFQLEGILRRHYFKDAQFIDAKAYGLLRTDPTPPTNDPSKITHV